MNIIISHDVDHLTALEHLYNLFLPKRILRSCIEFKLGYASFIEVYKRCHDIFKNRLHNLNKLITFDQEHDVPSTFFLGMTNGMYLNYKLNQAEYWIKRILEAGLNVGVHGINFDDLTKIQKEHDTFREITGLNKFGNRMHYLRMSEHTLCFLEKVGYAFDASIMEIEPPYKIGDIWEFPLQIMDVSLFNSSKGWRDKSFDEVVTITKKLIEHAIKRKIGYISISLHDTYFTSSYQGIYDWYRWTVEYAAHKRFQFVNYYEAIEYLEKN